MKLIFKLQVKIKKRKNHYLSICPDLDVLSQGDTEKEALRNIEEAVRGFLVTCSEMGTLWKVLDDRGIRPGVKIAKRRYPGTGKEISVPLALGAAKHKGRVEHCPA